MKIPDEPQCKEHEDAALIYITRRQYKLASQELGKAITKSNEPIRQRMYANLIVINTQRSME